jgi:ribonucleoside-diphosphate reductase alpha chain
MSNTKLLQDILHARTYAKTLPSGRKESRSETIERSAEMYRKKFPEHVKLIDEAFAYVHAGKVVGSMRATQFAGKPIEDNNARMFNCSFTNIVNTRDFADIFFLLMSGSGVGFSVQRRHVDQLPLVDFKLGKGCLFTVEDTAESWCEAIHQVMEMPSISFDYSKIRPKGAPMSSGGTASGYQALETTIEAVRKLLKDSDGRKPKPIEVFDMVNFIADGVAVGGSRRSALLCMFDHNDTEMLTSKHGNWWEENGQRARSNISAVVLRSLPNVDEIVLKVLDMMKASRAGEPAVILTNNLDMGKNPCVEIGLRSNGACNLTEVNAAMCVDVDDFHQAVWAATVIGTLQSSFTDFKFLQPRWKEVIEEDALLGVSITGMAANWPLVYAATLDGAASEIAVDTNLVVAGLIGVNPAKRITTTKPSGSTSIWLGTTSGVHAAHSDFYLRRIRIDRNNPIATALIRSKYPYIEDDLMGNDNIIVAVPTKMEGAITRNRETAIQLMERAAFIYDNWILPGHIEGDDTHNCSLTVSYKEDEWEDVKAWMIENKAKYSGISLLPYSDHTYRQAPFEEITEDIFNLLAKGIEGYEIDLSAIDFSDTIDERIGEAACAGGACEIL